VPLESKPKVKYPINSVLSYDNMHLKQLHLISSISSHVEPRLYEEVVEMPQWKEAMRADIEALKANDTWLITELPYGKTPIGCKWVFELKFNANGKVE